MCASCLELEELQVLVLAGFDAHRIECHSEHGQRNVCIECVLPGKTRIDCDRVVANPSNVDAVNTLGNAVEREATQRVSASGEVQYRDGDLSSREGRGGLAVGNHGAKKHGLRRYARGDTWHGERN